MSIINNIEIDNSTFINLNKKDGIMFLLDNILKYKSYKEIAEELNIAVGTIKRWKELDNIPESYYFELMKLANVNIDYSKFTYKEKDQFFTPIITAEFCYKKLLDVLEKNRENEEEFIYIEPSAGSGNFLKILPKNRTIAVDIEPKGPDIIEADYLKWLPTDKNGKYIVIGNPPFGLRGQLALKFMNHSYEFAEYVAFILPQLFESDGKGVPRKRVVGYHLLHSEKIDTNFIEPSGKEIKVNCIFQIWSKNHENDTYKIKKINTDIMKIYSLSDGGTPSTTRNKSMFDKCDIFIPSTCFGKENMKYYESFDTLPRKKGYGIIFNLQKEENIQKFKEIDWTKIAFLSTNSAYNIRSSKISELFK